MNCPRCGNKCLPGAAWCSTCGSALPSSAPLSTVLADVAPALADSAYASSGDTFGIYTPSERVLACERCGTPISTPIEGGTVACGACSTALFAPPRPDTLVPRSQDPDFERHLDHLRRQDGRPVGTPPGLESILSGSMIDQWKMQEARMIWGQTRRRLLTDPSDLAAAERDRRAELGGRVRPRPVIIPRSWDGAITAALPPRRMTEKSLQRCRAASALEPLTREGVAELMRSQSADPPTWRADVNALLMVAARTETGR
jgi:DNA-directed RNA polymerase subunit RPC12/RpoP